ncbi:MAG: P-loop NTPase [Sandaracinus sp.]|nr:P-loop NTPase [Sandaracinus sp.]MCB9632486.1 P-loop NTPase [Sandaracinus sp.]
MSSARNALLVSVGGGKGGVGKSLVAANLSVAFARLGMRVTLVDADLGAANQHTLFGLGAHATTLHSFLEKDVESLEEAIVPTCVPRLGLLPGAVGVPGAAQIGHARKLKLVRHLAALDAEVVVIDCGAGVGNDVLDFTELADLRVVVATPQLTSLQNAYAFLKSAMLRGFRQSARTRREQERFDAASSRSETERLAPFLERLAHDEPELARHLRALQESWGGFVVGNQIYQDGERRVIDGLVRMVRDFLGVELRTLGHLRATAAAHASVAKRRPLLVTEPHGEAARVLEQAAETLLSIDVRALRERRRRPAEDEELGRLADRMRRHSRHEVAAEGRLRGQGREAPAELLDVSTGGARLRSHLPVSVGANVTFEVSGARSGTFDFVVRWVGPDGALGVELRDASDGPALRVAAGLRPTSDAARRPPDACTG